MTLELPQVLILVHRVTPSCRRRDIEPSRRRRSAPARAAGIVSIRVLAARPLVVAACLTLALSACGQSRPSAADDVVVSWDGTPTPVAGVPAIATIRLRDGAGRPVRGASVSVEAHMAHPGMAPVIEKATERADGAYQVNLTLTMTGDWIVLVKGTLPDGRRLDQRLDIRNVRPSS